MGLHFPFDDVFDLEFKGHTIVVDRIQDHWIWNYLILLLSSFRQLVDFTFEAFELLFNISLYYFDSLYYYIFKYSLSLLQVCHVLLVLLIYLNIYSILEFWVNSVFFVQKGVHLTSTKTWSKWMTTVASTELVFSRQIPKVVRLTCSWPMAEWWDSMGLIVLCFDHIWVLFINIWKETLVEF